MSKLAPYNPDKNCSKCDCPLVRTKFEAVPPKSWEELAKARERLRRTCEGCGHVWYEAPLDAQEELPELSEKDRHLHELLDKALRARGPAEPR
jgi:hypothetical protein